jgi:CheY-like chemotaxis protein
MQMSAEPLTILLAEDDDGHAKLFQRNLERESVTNQIIRVSDGRSALDFARCEGRFAGRNSTGPVLMLLDISIPLVDGVEVLHRVKTTPSCRDLPVIMISATDDPERIKHCYALGCSAYIIKPFEYDEFIEILGRLGLFLHLVTRKASVDRQAGLPHPFQLAPTG